MRLVLQVRVIILSMHNIRNAIMLTLLIIFASTFAVVKADLILKPNDTEAVTGDSTYFDCTSNLNTNEVNWYHYAVGAKEYEDTCLYCLGRVHPQYENRIAVDRNFSTGNYELRIKNVQHQDAGRYICQDNGGIGESASAQLVVLESSPSCTSNMKPDGVLGPNDCGLEPDTLQLSCHVSYHGNIPPVIKWTKAKSRDPVKQSFSQSIDNRMTSNLTIMADIGQNDESYICETNRSTTAQYNCVSDIIRVIYVKSDNSTKKMVQTKEEKVFCSVNSSQSCINTWKWFDGVNEEIVSNGSALAIHKPGWYKCESECNIREKQCTVLSNRVHISELPTLSIPVVIAMSCTVTIVVSVLCCILISIVNRRKRAPSEESRRLIEVEEITSEVAKFTTKAATEKGLLIRGMAILGNELFAVTQKCSVVEVFDCKTLEWIRQWTQEELIRPADIVSCKQKRCLYIMDWKGDSVKKEVLCVDPNGTLLRNWETNYDYGNSISVTNEKNIIVVCLGTSKFTEYSRKGKVIRKLCLPDLSFPTHAIKLTNGDFLVSSGDVSHTLHRVCMVGADGKVKQSFGGEKGSDFDQLDQPIRLAAFSDGSVAVLESGNRRVLLLDKDLRFITVLLSCKKSGLQNPTRLLLDESNNQLFVADSNNGTGQMLAFDLKSNFFKQTVCDLHNN